MNPVFNSLALSLSPPTAHKPRMEHDAITSAVRLFDARARVIDQKQHDTFHALTVLLPELCISDFDGALLPRCQKLKRDLLIALAEESVDWPSKDGSTRRHQHHGILTDTSLPMWFAERFPEILDRGKTVLNAYFEDLEKCARELHSARCDLSAALGLRPPRQTVDAGRVWEQLRPSLPGLPLFNSHIPGLWLYLFKDTLCFHSFGRFLCSKTLSADLDRYCDQLRAVLRRAIQEWIDDVKRKVSEEFMTPVGNIPVVAEAI